MITCQLPRRIPLGKNGKKRCVRTVIKRRESERRTGGQRPLFSQENSATETRKSRETSVHPIRKPYFTAIQRYSIILGFSQKNPNLWGSFVPCQIICRPTTPDVACLRNKHDLIPLSASHFLSVVISKGPTPAPTAAELQGGAYLGTPAVISGKIEVRFCSWWGEGGAYGIRFLRGLGGWSSRFLAALERSWAQYFVQCFDGLSLRILRDHDIQVAVAHMRPCRACRKILRVFSSHPETILK